MSQGVVATLPLFCIIKVSTVKQMKLAEAHTKLNNIDKNQAPIPAKNKGGRGLWV